ncbi:MAG: Gfo/Idh/MocA family oxidoreductase [Nanoarchaeota archaeon]|nr:Gfo/Idh/MocA family oxidoreductase [Nanoarchaeota archaeon]MBU1103904.1 Gfo/Idh/MocA family oxidoreductase [Nanoarchaeota archaeon]
MKSIGIIGAGNFGTFLIESYKKIPGIKILAISSLDKKEILEKSKKYNIPHTFTNYKDLLQLKEIDIVAIPTPPFLHAQIIVDALKTNKHVVCEKPLALSIEQTKKIKSFLKNQKLTINYVLRKNPLIKQIKKIINSKVLGNVQSFSFSNYASTSHLEKNHWFWDKKKSGGIWVEHGVHFFDLFSYLFEQNVKSIKSISNSRPANKKIQDQVSCLCLYDKGILGKFEHSFSMPIQIEKTSFTIVFDKGYVNVEGWIPEKMQISAVLEKNKFNGLVAEIKNKEFEIKTTTSKLKEKIISRNSSYNSDFKTEIEIKTKKNKTQMYQQAVQEILQDLIKSIGTNKTPAIGFAEGVESLETALMAEKASM